MTNGFKGLFACKSLVIRTVLVTVGDRGCRYPMATEGSNRNATAAATHSAGLSPGTIPADSSDRESHCSGPSRRSGPSRPLVRRAQ